MKWFLLALAAVTLATLGLAATTTSSGNCSRQCNSSPFFAYETGKSYIYDYSIETSTDLIGVSDDEAKLRIIARANIDVISTCEFILRVTNVDLEGSSHSGEFREALTRYPLRLSFQDGMIESICSDISEPPWVLNIKRGLLSSFQNTMSYHKDQNYQKKEEDVSGVCKKQYISIRDGNIINVKKVTDLTSCSQRPDFSNFINSASYTTESPVQHLPILKSTNECHQKIKDEILISVECNEIYKSRPFESEKGVAITKIKTTLVLKSQASIQSVANYEFIRQSLVFDDKSLNIPTAQLEKAEQLLIDLVAKSRNDINADTPARFATLVDSLKSLDYSQLSQMFSSNTEIHTHKILVDAMPLVGTTASTTLVRDMILNHEMTLIEEDIWFTSLAFLKNPTAAMLTAIAPLLESSPRQKALLGTSALINNYCTHHRTCESESAVKEIIELLENQLGAGCRVFNQEEKTRVLTSLKAIGNAGHWINAKYILETCYNEPNDMEIRIAALDVWRHAPCEYDRSNVMALFQNEFNDPELRITAYLSLMSCPTTSLINIIKKILISEGVNQVGSFIWTHLTNLQESAAPEKQWLHELIGEKVLQKKFNTEALQFSRNYESSFFMDSLNIGGSVESNVIFNSKSYLPRSAMLNLTIDLFGESINFFEIGGRIEGFETYIEQFFGSNGYFPEEHIEQILGNMRSKSNTESTILEGFLNKITDEPEGSYYLRVFGNEIHYHHFKGLENIIGSSFISNPVELLIDIIRKGNVDYTKSFQLLDVHQYIPTLSGLPIVLNSKITGTVGLKVDGNFMAKSLTNMSIQGHIYPSAALEVSGLMVVDAHLTKTGVKMSSTLHTSTFLDGKIQVTDGKVVNLTINSPKERVEIIDVQGEFYYLVDNQEFKKDSLEKMKYEECTNGKLGMSLCGAVMYTPTSVTNSFFTTPAQFRTSLYLKKTGTQTGYVLQFKQENEKIEFLIDTPGSKDDHKLSLTIVKDQNTVDVNLHTPIISVQVEGEYIWTNLNKKLKVHLAFDTGEQYGFETGLITVIDDTIIYKPSLIFTFIEDEIFNMHGTIERSINHHDAKISSKMEINYKWGSLQKITFEFTAVKKLTRSMSTYSLYGNLDPTQFPELKTKLEMTFNEIERQQYNAKVISEIRGESYVFEGKLDRNSARGKFNVFASGTLVAPKLDVKGNFEISADSTKASFDWKTSVNRKEYRLKVDATKTSVVIEANIFRQMFLNAYIRSSRVNKKLHITGEWNKKVDPTASFMIDVQVAKDDVKTKFRFGEKEAIISGKRLDNAVELEGKWDTKRVAASIKYNLGQTKSISVSVITPFHGFEQQNAKFFLSLKNYEVNSRLITTWQNIEHATLHIRSKYKPGVNNNSLNTELVLRTSLPTIEHFSVKLDHDMASSLINTKLIVNWDDLDVKADVNSLPTSNGIQSTITLEAPFIAENKITLNHNLSSDGIGYILEAKYGSYFATATLNGTFDRDDSYNTNLHLKIDTSLEFIQSINAKIKYKFNWSQIYFLVEGIVGENKMLMDATGELTEGPAAKLNGNLRFIMPGIQPITATFTHTHDLQVFETRLEITQFWWDYGNLVVHVNSHMSTSNDVLLFTSFTTSSTKASVYLKHKVADENVISSLEAQLNMKSINISVNGILDISSTLVHLEIEIFSTFSNIDKIKITLDCLKYDNEGGSKNTTKNTYSINGHLITQIPEWETINLDGDFNLEDSHFTGNFEAMKSSKKYQLTTDIVLDTPRFYFNVVTPIAGAVNIEFLFDSKVFETERNVSVSLKVNEDIYSIDIRSQIIYKTGYIRIFAKLPISEISIIDIEANYNCLHDVINAELNLKIKEESNFAYLKANIIKNTFIIELCTPYDRFEVVKIVGDYKADFNKHIFLASLQTNQQVYDYSAEIIFTEYNVSISLSTPIEEIESLTFSMNYKHIKSVIESLIFFEKNGVEFKLQMKAFFAHKKCNFFASVATPFKNYKILLLDARYDVLSETKELSLTLQRDNILMTVSIIGQYNLDSQFIEVKVIVDGLENIIISYTFELNLNNYKLENSLRIKKKSEEWNSIVHVQYSYDMIVLKFEMPFKDIPGLTIESKLDFEQKNVYVNIQLGLYNFFMNSKWAEAHKGVTFEVTHNEQSYAVNTILNVTSCISKLTLQAVTPFPSFSNINIMIKYDSDNQKELVSFKIEMDQHKFSSVFSGNFQGSEAYLKWDLFSTVQGWNHVQFSSNINFDVEHNTLEISLGKNENLKAIKVSGTFNKLSEVSFVITTPYQGMKKMGGQYKLTTGVMLEGSLDLFFPFSILPNIHGYISLDLSENVIGKVNLNIAEELYAIQCNLVGASLEEGYIGDLQIYTPFHILSKICLNVNIRLKTWTMIQTHFLVDLPCGIYEVNWNTEIFFEESSFKVDIDTTIVGKKRKFSLLAKFSSFANLEGSIVTMLEDQTYKIKGKLISNINTFDGYFGFESSLIERERHISFILSFPTSSYQHMTLKMTFTSIEVHSLYLNYDLTNGLKTTIFIESTIVGNISITLDIIDNVVALVIESASGVHQMEASWVVIEKKPSDFIGTLVISSPLLKYTYSLNLICKVDESRTILKAEFMKGDVLYVVEGLIFLNELNGDTTLEINIPALNMKIHCFIASLKDTSQVKMHLEISHDGENHIFNLTYGKDGNFFLHVSSILLPTGMIQGEGQITGNTMKDMLIKISISYNEKTILGTMMITALSQNHMETDLLIITPFKGYKNIHFSAVYLKDEDTKIVVSVNIPIKLIPELYFHNTKQVMSHLMVNTHMETMEKIEGKLEIPLNWIAPRVFAHAIVGGVNYSSHLAIRTKAPYEFDIGCMMGEICDAYFHLRTDSSFFSAFII